MLRNYNIFIRLAIISALLGLFAPLISIWLETNVNWFLGESVTEKVYSSLMEDIPKEDEPKKLEIGKRSFTEFGAVGDWLGGSSVPFLTLATLLIAFSTFLEQGKEFKLTREEAKLTRAEAAIQNDSVAMQRFENTFFLLLEEVRNRHEEQMYYTIGEHEFNKYRNYLEVLTEIMPDIRYSLANNSHITDAQYFDYAVRYKKILGAVHSYHLDWKSEQIQRLKQLTGKIFELFTIYDLPEHTREFYAEILKIHLSKPAISAMLYLSLEDFYHSDEGNGFSTNSDRTYKNSVLLNFTKFRFFDFLIKEHSEHIQVFSEDYLFFEKITRMNDYQRVKFHNDSMHLVQDMDS
jgi:hypothetical protein